MSASFFRTWSWHLGSPIYVLYFYLDQFLYLGSQMSCLTCRPCFTSVLTEVLRVLKLSVLHWIKLSISHYSRLRSNVVLTIGLSLREMAAGLLACSGKTSHSSKSLCSYLRELSFCFQPLEPCPSPSPEARSPDLIPIFFILAWGSSVFILAWSSSVCGQTFWIHKYQATICLDSYFLCSTHCVQSLFLSSELLLKLCHVKVWLSSPSNPPGTWGSVVVLN